MTSVALDELLGELDATAQTELSSTPDVVVKDDALDTDDLPIQARRWHKATDVVAVFADLKNSSRLGVRMHAASTASVYEASVGGVVRILNTFDANYIDIQGDAAFGVFWGEFSYERAICSGITIRTFSDDLTERLERKWPEQPQTGFRVGVAASSVLVKRIGIPRNPSQQRPVWAGRPVNYASKAASSGDRNQVVVTGTVWDYIEKNDYLTLSCSCSAATDLWENVYIDKLRTGDDKEAAGRLLRAPWCKTHGNDYCSAVLDGQLKRTDIEDAQRNSILSSQKADPLRWKAHEARKTKRLQMQGLNRGHR